MSDTTKTQETKQLTAADVAKLVKRAVTVTKPGKDGEPPTVTATRVAVKAEEVMAFKDYGTHVVVVTTDGQKLSSAGAEA